MKKEKDSIESSVDEMNRTFGETLLEAIPD